MFPAKGGRGVLPPFPGLSFDVVIWLFDLLKFVLFSGRSLGTRLTSCIYMYKLVDTECSEVQSPCGSAPF